MPYAWGAITVRSQLPSPAHGLMKHRTYEASGPWVLRDTWLERICQSRRFNQPYVLLLLTIRRGHRVRHMLHIRSRHVSRRWRGHSRHHRLHHLLPNTVSSGSATTKPVEMNAPVQGSTAGTHTHTHHAPPAQRDPLRTLRGAWGVVAQEAPWVERAAEAEPG